VAMGASILFLFFIPWLDRSPVKSMRYKGPLSRIALALFLIAFVLLGYLGTLAVTPFRQILAQVCTLVYFAYFILMPVYTRFDSYKQPPERVSE